MGQGDAVALALWVWLFLTPLTQAGVIKQIQETEDDTAASCLTYTLNSLVHVDCTEQNLSELPEGLDENVQVLLLSNNEFTSFPPQLESFKELEMLDLSNNLLSAPLPNYVQDLEKLHTLNLSNNNYDAWTDTRSSSIKKLDLSKNKINNIENDSFNGMTQLRFLELSENRIHDLPSTLFSSVQNLEVLMLSRNYFSMIPHFQSHSLKSLHLNNCQISELEKDSLSEMSSLLELFLSMNQIESIPDNFASNTLQELDLSYNDISSLSDNSLASLPHLAVLNLRGNDFKHVWSTSHFSSNPYLREVHVKGNRWNCEGFHLNLLLTYEYLTKDPPKVVDTGSLICYSPTNVTQMSWQQAYIRTWHPGDDSTMSYTTLAVFIGVIIGVVITSCICRGLMKANEVDAPRQTTVLNINGTTPRTQPAVETVVLRIPLHDEDLPPSYDEALLMPRLNSSFHSLPDFIDEEEELSSRNFRRSRSIGDITEYRPRTHDRRSMRRTVHMNPTQEENGA